MTLKHINNLRYIKNEKLYKVMDLLFPPQFVIFSDFD